MSSNYYGALAYNDEKLYTIVYRTFENEQYVISCDEVYRGEIAKVSKPDEINSITTRINEAIKAIEEDIENRIHRIDLIVEPQQFYYEAKSFEADFDEAKVITKADVDNVHKQAVSIEDGKEGYTPVSFIANQYALDNKKTKSPINEQASKMLVIGDLVYADRNTIYALERILDASRYQKQDILISSHLLKYSTNFADEQAIVEFGRKSIKFLVKNNGLVKNYNIEFGIGNFYEQLYLELIKDHDLKESEKAVRFLQNNFNLANTKFDFEIGKDLTFNTVNSQFVKIVNKYIQGIILQVEKQGVEFTKIYSITNDYSNNEWINCLKRFLEVKIEEYKVNSVNGNFNDELKIFNAIAIKHKLRLKG